MLRRIRGRPQRRSVDVEKKRHGDGWCKSREGRGEDEMEANV